MIGSKHTNILSSTIVDQQIECLFDGAPITSRFQELYTVMETAAGAEGAALFSLPASGFSKARQANMTTWYTDQGGVFRPLDALSHEERQKAESLLRSILSSALSGTDAIGRTILSAALNLPSIQDVYFNGDCVVLANWGLLSAGDAGRPLAPYLPKGFNLSRESRSQDAHDLSEQKVVVADLVEEARHEPSTQNNANSVGLAPGYAAVSTVGNRGFRQAAFWLSTFALTLALVLLYLLWPGNLVYPGQGDGGAASLREANQQATDSARDQVSRLRNALSGNLCNAQNLEELDSVAGLPLLPSASAPQTSLPFGVIPGDPPPASPPGTNNPSLPGPQSSTPSGPARSGLRGADLIDKLDNGTVIVVGLVGDGVSIGSGFLVSPNQVITNDHVVADVGNRKIYISNKHLARPVSASVVARSGHTDGSTPDFALLQLDTQVDLPRLPLSPVAGRLDSVVAAGYPKFVTETDPAFASAIDEGNFDQLNSLQLAMTRGEITAVQAEASGMAIVAHSATISPGNSGGPLVDRCGRVVGINTFTRSDSESALHLNYALSSRDIIKFLGEHGVATESDNSVCSTDAPQEPSPAAVASPPAPQGQTPQATGVGIPAATPPNGSASPSTTGAAAQ